jgi:hypothetical protein
MEPLQVIAPLIGVVLGGSIAGLSALLRARAERKKMIGRALSDLLEIRHHIVGIEAILREVRSRTQVSDEEAQLFRTHMNAVAPLDTDIHKRYDEAISLLSGVDPILAFQMRSKNKLPLFLDSMQNVSASLGVTAAQKEAVEGILRLAVIPALDQAILRLAELHSRTTARQAKDIVSAAPDFEPELRRLFDGLTKSPSEQ